MFFNKEEIKRLPDYGEVIKASDFLEKLEEALRSNRIIFEADYMYEDYVHLDTAIELLYSLKKIK